MLDDIIRVVKSKKGLVPFVGCKQPTKNNLNAKN